MTEKDTLQEESSGTINKAVFYTSASLIILLVGFAALFPEVADKNFKNLQQEIFTNASWFYILAVALILLSVTFLGLSRYGDIKLGPDHAKPDFSYHSWFAMLFSAGMGIGLMFFGVAEPVMHYLSPPVGTPETVEAAKQAMRLTFFHWGLHAWAIYAIVALILAFFSYRHGLPLTLRSALYPILGERIYGPIGHAVDIFAVIGTVFGVATSLGYGVLQVNAGLNHLFGVPVNEAVQVILIIIITALATISVVSGLDKGIRILSELNLGLAILLLILVLLLGPTVLLLKSFVENTGGYLSELVSKTFNLYAYEPKSSNWLGGWTLLYWGWWLSWSPFVGMFIARVSRGRTIREFVTGVLFVPAGFTLMWMTVFGNSAIYFIMAGATDLANTVQQDVALALFNFLEHFPFSSILSFIAMAMVIVFFITSADSGAMVVDTLASGGVSHTPVWQRIFWASLMGIVAIALLVAGGLSALQTVTIASALPFSVILLISIYGLLKALRRDITKRDSQNMATIAPTAARNPIPWQRRLRNIAYLPKRSLVKRFMDDVIHPAMVLVEDELTKQGTRSSIDLSGEDRIRLEVDLGEELNFIYEVRLRGYNSPAFALAGLDTNEQQTEQHKYYRAEIYLKEGGQNYDVMGWNQEQLINDILDQYEKHLHFLHLVR